MQGKQIVLVALLSALLSSGVTALIGGSLPNKQNREDSSQVRERLKQLESALTKQQEVTRSLEQRVQLNQSQPTSSQIIEPDTPEANPETQNLETAELTREEQIREFRERAIAQRQPDVRRQRLIDNGFAEDEASWVLQQEAQVQLDSLTEQYRARRARVELEKNNGTQAKSRFDQLKEKLGEDYFKRYLEANGLPTSVGVNSVLENSPGSNAGLQAGDRILSYDGNRVFNIRELNGLTILGQEGQSVLVEVQRNGNPIQITLPRGPIGITGGRGRF